MEKYVGAVLRKSFQLELVAEIGPFENPLSAQKNQRKYIEKGGLVAPRPTWGRVFGAFYATVECSSWTRVVIGKFMMRESRF